MARLINFVKGQVKAMRSIEGLIIHDKIKDRNIALKCFDGTNLIAIDDIGNEIIITPANEEAFSYVRNPNEKVAVENVQYDDETHTLSWDGGITNTGNIDVTEVFGSYKGDVFVRTENELFAYDIQSDWFKTIHDIKGEINYLGKGYFTDKVIYTDDDGEIDKNASYQTVFGENNKTKDIYGSFIIKAFFDRNDDPIFVFDDGRLSVSSSYFPVNEGVVNVNLGGKYNDIVTVITEKSVCIETDYTQYHITNKFVRDELLAHSIFVSKRCSSDSKKETFSYSDNDYDIFTFVVEHTDRGDLVTFATE